MTVEVKVVIHFFHLLDVQDECALAWLEITGGEGVVNLKPVQR
jgi:hypothetical protein